MYSELKAKSHYSFLRASSSPEELIEEATRLGIQALGLCDLNGVYGIPKAYWHAKQHSSNIKLLTGAELCIDDLPSLTFLAQSRPGYALLCSLITRAFQGRDKGQASLALESLTELLSDARSQNLICLCPASFPVKNIRDLFKENLYITLSRHLDGHDRRQTENTLTAARQWGLPLVATNDVLFATAAKRPLLDVMTAIRLNQPLVDLGYALSSNTERRLKSPLEMQHLFRDLPEALKNTLVISERCEFCPSQLRYEYPNEWIPKGESSQSYLARLTWAGAEERYPKGIPLKVRVQLLHELHLIEELEFADYFLTIYDIVAFARRKNILCQGRGSAANSVVCYCLGITAIDPVQMNLLFERFLSAERGEPPDIDIDFEHERREEILQYVYTKYGRHRAAMVCTMITYRKRSALRDVAKAFSVSVGTLSAKKLERTLETSCKESRIPNSQDQILRVCEQLKGTPRHPGIHSGGFILSSLDLSEIVPVEPARMEGRTVIQWDKYDLDYLGLIKVDLLSLGMLSVLQKALTQTKQSLYEIPLNDAPTYAMIQKADTVGTFQIESRAQMSMLGRLKPKNFYDLVVEVAIVRPGPIVGQMVHPYLKRRQGIEPVSYPHPKLKEILGKTLGVPLFQEQVMKMAIEVAGFTPGEADELRRSIAAWKTKSSVNKMATRLYEGLRNQGIPEEFCQKIYQQIFGFSKYGFPESHAASFALLAYASCYLKCHYPSVFTCALLNSQPMGFYSTHTLVNDAKRHGVDVLALHPNFSEWDCVARGSQLQLGWRIVKGLSETEGHRIARGRPYMDLPDFLERTSLRKDLLYRLALAGCFDCWKLDRRHTLWELLRILPESRESTLNGFMSQGTNQVGLFEDLSDLEKSALDFEAFRLSTRGHPMEFLRKTLREKPLTTQQAKAKRHGVKIKAAGLNLVLQRPPTAKGVVFSTLEDEFGFLDLIIRPEVYESFRNFYDQEAFLLVEGTLQRQGDTCNLIVQKVAPLQKERATINIEPNRFFY